MVKRSLFLLLSVMLVAVVTPVAASAATVSVWVQNAADRAFYTSPRPAGAPASVNLHTAKNEYEAAQILVRSSAAQSDVSVTARDLSGPGGAVLSASNITVSRVANHTGVWKVPTDYEIPPGDGPGVSGDYTDALIENVPVNVAARTTQPYWYSVYTPAGQAAGTYTGVVTVNSSLGNVDVPVAVKVYDVTLPPTNQSTFKMNNWFGSAGWDYTGVEESITKQYGVRKYDDNWWKVMKNIARNHSRHRNNVIHLDFQALLIPDTTISSDGSYRFGWQTFDRFVQLFIDQGALQYIATPTLLEYGEKRDSPRLLEMLKNVNGETTRTLVTPDTPESTAYLHTLFKALKEHLAAKGWADRFYMAATDEPVTVEQYKQSSWLYGIYKQYFTGSDYKTLEAHERLLPGPEYDTLASHLSTYAITTELYDASPSTFQNLRMSGKELWLYTAIVPQGRHMNRFLSYHLDKTRLLPWLAWKVGGVGFLHWGWNYWTDTADTFAGDGGGFGDAWLVRPNKAAYDVYDSVRSEAQRDGVEDYELLTKLQAVKPVTARAIANTLIDDTQSYTRSGAAVVDQHRQLLQQLTSSQGDPQLPFSDNFSRKDDRDWVHTKGSWSVSRGAYTQSSVDDWNNVSAVKGRAYSDFVMTFDTKIDAVNPHGGDTNWTGAVIRGMNATDIDSGYLIGLRNNGNIFLVRSGAERASATVPGYTPGAFTNVKISAQGGRIRVYANDHPAPLIDITDTAYQAGHVAVVTGGAAGTFDNVVIKPEHAQGTPAQAAGTNAG